MDGFNKNKNKMSKITEQQITDWKAQYGDIYELPVEDKTAILRAPKMVDYKRAFTALQNDGDIAFAEELLNCLFIGGDPEIKKDDDYFNAARKILKNFFEYADADIVTTGNKSVITIGDAKCTVRVITRDDIKLAEKKNPSGKPFVTQEKLFEMICKEMDDVFKDKDNAMIRFPLYQAIEILQNKKIAILKKL
jgi:hypothetical protein